ncbi:MAG: hypothetical protein LBE12_16125 [Planctomycetaceae bacterium]|nr:hypothetical protein [Planctomycetaceae bacterium]
MSQADYYPNGNNSACGTLHFPLSTLHYYVTFLNLNNNSTDILRNLVIYQCNNFFGLLHYTQKCYNLSS